jgi:glycosyltransferase involved in cell wall biosynthesis
MLISVAMATYNGARHLHEQLESLAAQTVLPAELVVGDDGSDDDTLSILKSFSQTAPFPVRFLPREERRGFADNFLRIAAACEHPLVAFCDQDDVWLPAKLRTCLQRIEADDSLLALHRLTTTNDALEPIGLWTQGIETDAVFEPLALDPYKNGWGNSMLFRRELVTAIPYGHRPRQPEVPERPLSHDTWIYVLAAALGRVSHIAEPLVLYRQHGRNAIGVTTSATGARRTSRASLSMNRLRERMVFYRHMASSFDDLAHQGEAQFSAAARAASKRYTDRHDPIAARMAIYDGPSLVSRLRAFRKIKHGAGLSSTSRAKDLVFGVSGLHNLLA